MNSEKNFLKFTRKMLIIKKVITKICFTNHIFIVLFHLHRLSKPFIRRDVHFIHVCVWDYVSACVCVHTCVYMYVCVCLQCICVHVHLYAHLVIFVLINMCMLIIYIEVIHAFIYLIEKHSIKL